MSLILLGAQSRQSAKLFLQSSELGLPQPLTHRRECPPPLWFGGEGHTRWRGRSWESPNFDEGTYTVVLFIYTYFVAWGYLLYTFQNQMFARSQLAFFAAADLTQPHSIHPFPPDEKWFFVISFSVHLPTCMPHNF